MTIDTTYLEMYCANEEVNKFCNDYPVVSKMILGERVSKFPRENAVYLNLMYEKIRKIYESHVELLPDGKDFAMKNTVVDDGNGNPMNKVEPKYKDEQHEAQFKEEWNKLMSSHAQITI